MAYAKYVEKDLRHERGKPYTNANRRDMAEALLAAQRDWAIANPGAHPGLKAGDHMVSAAHTESILGEPRFMANKFYNGVLQLNPTIPVKDTFAWPEVLQATSDSLNRMAAFNPAVLRDTGGKPWTPDLIKQHYKDNTYVQAVGTLESGAADVRTMGIKLDGLTPKQQAGIIYMSHVIPQAAKIISDNLNYKGPLNDLITADRINALPNLNEANPEKVKGWVQGNPQVFAKGTKTPLATLDNWIAKHYTNVIPQYADLIDKYKDNTAPAGAVIAQNQKPNPAVAQRVPEAWDRTLANPSSAPLPEVDVKNLPGGDGTLSRVANWLAETRMPNGRELAKSAYSSVSNWVAEKWNGSKASDAPSTQPKAAPPPEPPKAAAPIIAAPKGTSERFATLSRVKKDNATGLRDDKQKPIVADGDANGPHRNLAKQLKPEVVEPPNPPARKPQKAAAVRMD